MSQVLVAHTGELRREPSDLSVAGKYILQFMRSDNLQLLIGAIARLLVESPSPELRHMPEAITLHMFVGDFRNEFGTERLP